jgi:hypothetical protein
MIKPLSSKLLSVLASAFLLAVLQLEGSPASAFYFYSQVFYVPLFLTSIYIVAFLLAFVKPFVAFRKNYQVVRVLY